ncbi:MAG: indole-3-glycerol phosphate synthase TrpC [Alphaproteobacteria bacterium]|nr:indole-3-glycerol phosphate synthase TrpC [Alphaproteobacteria bacterium]
MSDDVLARICADKRLHVAARKALAPLGELERRAAAAQPPRGFAEALRQMRRPGRPALIAEIKKASPSRGLIRRAGFEPASLARAYRAGGAACLSVLTDRPYFQGRDEDLDAARSAVDLPVLRKDFILDPYQVVESRAIGADCILLIVAALDDATMRDLAAQARGLGLDVLVEVHDEAELDRALALPDVLLGVNNRNLKTLTVDLATFERLAPRAPGRFLVAESGLKTPADIARVDAAGAGAILVGESLMAQSDVTAAARALLALAPQEAS